MSTTGFRKCPSAIGQGLADRSILHSRSMGIIIDYKGKDGDFTEIDPYTGGPEEKSHGTSIGSLAGIAKVWNYCVPYAPTSSFPEHYPGSSPDRTSGRRKKSTKASRLSRRLSLSTSG